MLLVYNVLQIFLAPLIIVLLPLYLISRPEKCKTILPKLGYRLEPVDKQDKSIVWVHALSVGEVTSVQPLVKAINKEQADSVCIIFSASTVSGLQLGRELLSPYCDRIFYAPLDIFPVVRYFLKRLKPDLFILVETDFWPNLLHSFTASNIPALLVNGRVSGSSIKKYRQFGFFFRPLFEQFSKLCMQTSADGDKMRTLGINDNKIEIFGNLKFAGIDDNHPEGNFSSPFPEGSLVVLAGSTHEGEEEVLLDIFQSLVKDFKLIHLAVAPRNISRIDKVATLIEDRKFSFRHFSDTSLPSSDITLIDTIGDLSSLYGQADICFIGGSLVDEGGHNPIEPARYRKATVFGPHMDDFSEISAGLVKAGGAIQTTGSADLEHTIVSLLSSESKRESLGKNGFEFVSQHQPVIADHLSLIRSYL